MITNNLKAGCFSDVADRVTSKGWTNKISDAVNKIFGTSKKYNITFYNRSAWPASYPKFPEDYAGLTWARYFAGVLKVDVYLNDIALANASQEHIAATLLHEIAHGIIKYEGKDGETSDHNVMYQQYITEMTKGLQEMFPAIDPYDADALAYEGLLETIWGAASLKAFPMMWKNRQDVWKAYLNGTKGTKCK
ncbi:MAG TPA: hypothetical protein VM802_20175 [Chitinophaga sp.]|uniref:hypothetical protein n=1 Tax=Chitinophaga sp. TaxID=1869181 RepID=UPI002C9FDD33|nr:hypothetical protein [Chitinophaga sp.]HVI47206.1 hypothetical protein [Chitinophaga sp.]